MEHASTVDIGTRKRRASGINEDSVATTVLENHHRETGRSVGIFVLGDGVGGEASGDVASFLTTTVVRKHLTDAVLGSGTDVLDRFDVDAYEGTPPTVSEDVSQEAALSEERIRAVIQEGIDAAHHHVQQYARDVGERPATTVVAAVYADGRLHFGWAGDSRLYVVNRKHESIQQLTRDHAVTNRLLEQGEIDDEEHARVHEDATAITNAVGGSGHGKPSIDVEFGSVPIYSEDILLLTSDGLIDAYPDVAPLRAAYKQADETASIRAEIRETLVTDDEIRDLVLRADDLQEGVESLVAFANERGGKDNLSITMASDPAAAPTPDRLPARGIEADRAKLAGQETEIESPDEPDAESNGSGTSTSEPEPNGEAAVETGDDPNSAPDSGATADVVSIRADESPTAAIRIVGEERVFEIGDGISLGRVTDSTEDGPDIGLDVGGEGIVEPAHTTVEYVDDAEEWRIRDLSSSGTYVEVDPGEWMLLLSEEGVELHREHGFDPGAAAEEKLSETEPLANGTVFTLQDPRSPETVEFQFFGDVEDAQGRPDRGEGTEFNSFVV